LIAKNLISNIVAPLHKDDTGEQALSTMNVYHVKHLPIVDQKELISLLSEDDILNNDLDATIGSYKIPSANIFCFEGEHLFEVMQKMAMNKLTVLPVIDKANLFLGLITMEDIIQYFGESYSFTERGSIIILETNRQSYSLSEIARIAESEGILIFSSFITSNIDTTVLYVTLKLNSFDVSRLISAFQRYDYTVSGTFTEEEYIDTLKERYDSLMNYLSV
jgi:acetoin utilization protein AcuB